MDGNIFSERLRKARRDKDMSQKQLAERIGVSATTLTNYETGKSKLPCADTLLSIAKVLDISIDWLLGNDRGVNADNGKTTSNQIQKEDVKNAFNVLFFAFGKKLQIVNTVVGQYQFDCEILDEHANTIYISDDSVQKYLSDYAKVSTIDIDKITLKSVLDAIFPKQPFHYNRDTGTGEFLEKPDAKLDFDLPF